MKLSYLVLSGLLAVFVSLGLWGTISATRPNAAPPRVPHTTPTLTPSPTPTSTPTAGTCQTDTESLTVTAAKDKIHVGERVKIVVTLTNEGCATLGLPEYFLHVVKHRSKQVLVPANPKPIEHSLGLSQGESDKAKFVLHGAHKGKVDISSYVSLEVGLGPGGPYYWSGAGSNHITVQVLP